MKRSVFSGVLSVIFIIGLLAGGCADTPSSHNGNSASTPPEEEFHVYIAFGQSNMQGPGEIRLQDKTGISDRWQILNVVNDTYAGENRVKGQWYKAVPPLIIPDRNLVNYLGLNIGLGPSDHFGRTLVDGTPDHITIGVVAVANGDLALAAFRKAKGADYFDATKGNGGNGKENNRPSDTERQGWTRYTGAGYASLYDAIIKNAKIAQQTGVIKGIIVHQGESGRGLTDKTWAEMLKEIYDDMLVDLELPPNSIPILLGQTWNGGSGNTDGALAGDSVIQETLSNAWIISSKDCGGRTGNGQPDNTHFGSEGLELLGTRYGEKMLKLVYKN
jgi:hypothetical protein